MSWARKGKRLFRPLAKSGIYHSSSLSVMQTWFPVSLIFPPSRSAEREEGRRSDSLLQGWHQCFQLFLTADTTYKIYFAFSFDSLFSAPLAIGNQRVTQITTGKLHFFIVLFIKKCLLKIKNYKFYGSATADCILLLRLSVE